MFGAKDYLSITVLCFIRCLIIFPVANGEVIHMLFVSSESSFQCLDRFKCNRIVVLVRIFYELLTVLTIKIPDADCLYYLIQVLHFVSKVIIGIFINH